MTTKLSLIPPRDVSNELQAVHRQFEQWRRTRQPGARIPDRLWAAAATVARRHGVSRTARLLHLESQKLKRLTTASPGRRASPPPAFVELLPPPVAEGSGEYTVEVEGPQGGRLRVQFRGAPELDVAALTRIVWGADT